MNTNITIGIVVGIVLIGAGVWYVVSSPQGDVPSDRPAPNSAEDQSQSANDDEASQDAGEGTLAALMGRVGSFKCTVSSRIEDAPSEGEVYIADGKIRGTFTSTVQGSTYVSNMIQADGYVYTWSDAYPQGVKVSIPEGGEETPSASGGMDYDSRVQYDCDAWRADASLFVPPADISFMELGAGGMPNMGNMQNMPMMR